MKYGKWRKKERIKIRKEERNWDELRLALLTRLTQRYSARLWAGWSGIRVPEEAGTFSLYHGVQTASGAHPASYPMGTRSSFSEDKAAEAWSWPHSPPSNAEVKEWVQLYLHFPQYTFMASCLVKSRGTTLPLPCLPFGVERNDGLSRGTCRRSEISYL
jgi:hypothetical protein